MAKILVIDDDISLLQLLKNALEYDHTSAWCGSAHKNGNS